MKITIKVSNLEIINIKPKIIMTDGTIHTGNNKSKIILIGNADKIKANTKIDDLEKQNFDMIIKTNKKKIYVGKEHIGKRAIILER